VGASSSNYVLFYFILRFYRRCWQNHQLLGALPEQVPSAVTATNRTKIVIARQVKSWPKGTVQEHIHHTLHLAGKRVGKSCSKDEGNDPDLQAAKSALFTSSVSP